jgi:AraC-like DNA-binding protein
LHFSTDTLPASDRIAVWREVYGQAILRLDIEPLRDRQFRADIRLHALPGLGLASGVIYGACDQRTRALVADGNDDLGIAIHWGGATTAAQCGREATLGDGGAVLMSCGDPGTVTRPSPCRYLGLRFPRHALARRVPGIEDLLAVPIPRGSPGLRLLQTYVTSLVGNDEVLAAPTLHGIIVDHVYDLVAVALGAAPDAGAVAGGLPAALLQAVKDDIIRRLRSRDLTIGALAARHKVTPRYIQRLFEREGTSFTSFVLGQRLALAHRLLNDPRHRQRAISAIAFDVGFGDLSYFNRSFRRHFGATPSDVRARALCERG